MRIKNAFKVLISNFKLIYKSAFARLFVTALFCAIGYFAIYDHVHPILTHELTIDLLDSFQNLLLQFFTVEDIDTQRLVNSFNAFMEMINQNSFEIFVAASELFCIISALRILITMFEYAFGKVINGFMSARSRYGVLSNLFLNFGKAFGYAFCYVTISFIIEIAILIITTAILIGGLQIISIFAVFFAILFLATSMAFKFSIMSSFLPNIIVDGMGISKALINTSPKNRKHFASLFGSYFFLILVGFYVNVSFAAFTLFMGLAITIPVTGLYFTTVSIVDKYCCNGKRYYTDDDHIAGKDLSAQDASLTKFMD